MHGKHFFYDDKRLAQAKEGLASGEARLRHALDMLVQDAQEALSMPRISVIDNATVPPSGDKRDYSSISPYMWLNPDTADGLPYVYRDGEFNPDYALCDRHRIEKVFMVVQKLALAYYYTGEAAYREKAVSVIHTFFLNEETGMHPHLEYAQSIKGKCTGRGIGIIDTRNFFLMLDVLPMLDDEALTLGMRGWVGQFLSWLRTSNYGRDEQIKNNNHGTWYDVQCAVYAYFIGDDQTARSIVDNFATHRIRAQVEPDGSQPHELRRTRSFLYSTLNLYGFSVMARLAQTLGADLFHETETGVVGTTQTLAFMMPAYEDVSKWAYPQINDYWVQTWEQIVDILTLAQDAYGGTLYEDTAQKVYDTHIPGSYVLLRLP